jgi:uncharacterized protein YbjT (DUF2867 family)
MRPMMADTLVIGGAGRTGRLIVAQLDGARAFSRRSGGSIADAAAVRAAVDGVGAVVIVVESATSPGGENGYDAVHHQGVVNVIDACAGRDVHVVLITQIYITRPERMPRYEGLIAARARGEEALRASGLPYTILRPSWLTEEPGGRAAIRLEQGDTGDGEVSRADVAAVCVAALRTPAARGKTFELYNEPGAPPGDWAAAFGALLPDA